MILFPLCAITGKHEKYGQIFIFNHPEDSFKFNLLFKITINTHILWKQERIIWIGYCKNDKNVQCLIARLPKDILKKILNFVH